MARGFSIVLAVLFPLLLESEITPVRVVPPGVLSDVRQPQATVVGGGKVYVVYGSSNSIYCSVSHDDAKTFGMPNRVGEVGALALGMRRGPRIAATPRSVTVTAIGGTIGRGRDGDVLSWRSRDGGVTWSAPVKVNDSPASAREGLHAMSAGLHGEMACVWLDLRSGKTEIYASFSGDEGATWGPNRLVYRSPGGGVCECCHPSVAYDSSGIAYIMWRNHIEGARDLYLSESHDRGVSFTPAKKLGAGTWQLNACPMDGGAVSSASGQTWSVWRRGGEIYKAESGKSEQWIGTGVQPWTTATSAGVYTVWLSRRPGDLYLTSPNSGGSPRIIANRAADPVVAGPLSGVEPVVVVWESSLEGAPTVLAARIK